MDGPFAAGPGGYCICPECGHKIKHVAGKPCNRQKCPKCGAQMTRE
jgi:transposase